MILRKMYLRLIGDYRCAQFVEAVTEYLEGTMPPPERALFERHLKRCGGCETYLDQIRRTIAESGRVSIDDVNALPSQARNELMDAYRAFHAGE